MTIALLKLLLMGGACGGAEPTPAQPPAEGAPEQLEAAAADKPAPKVFPVIVSLAPPKPTGAYPWQTEMIGIYTLLVEVGMMELQGVIVVTNGRPVSPGLSHPIGQDEGAKWSAELKFERTASTTAAATGANATIEVELELCTNGGRRCKSTAATGDLQHPELAVAELLEFVSTTLEREPAAGAVAQWRMPVSQDPYAVLIAGRSAATWYGLTDFPVEQELDKAKDPVLKAVHLDPSMALAQWLLGRRFALRGMWDKAMPAFAAAREGRPLMPVFLADEAMTMQAERRELAAADAWESLLDAVPNDPRFLLARVETELAAGRLSQARDQLKVLVEAWEADSRIAAARVELADKSGEEQGMDDLLAHWAVTDPKAPEPVRRRIQLRIRQGGYREAWEMLPELRARGANDVADQYEIPLGVALEEWDTAASAAERVGNPDVAARIRARAKLEVDPTKTPQLPEGVGPEGLVVLGRVALAQNDATRALQLAERADKLRPWDPAVMALHRDALAGLGRDAAAQSVAVRIDLAEPPSPAVMIQ